MSPEADQVGQPDIFSLLLSLAEKRLKSDPLDPSQTSPAVRGTHLYYPKGGFVTLTLTPGLANPSSIVFDLRKLAAVLPKSHPLAEFSQTITVDSQGKTTPELTAPQTKAFLAMITPPGVRTLHTP